MGAWSPKSTKMAGKKAPQNGPFSVGKVLQKKPLKTADFDPKMGLFEDKNPRAGSSYTL